MENGISINMHTKNDSTYDVMYADTVFSYWKHYKQQKIQKGQHALCRYVFSTLKHS